MAKDSIDLLMKYLAEIKTISAFLSSSYGMHAVELSDRIRQLNGYHGRLPEIIATLDFICYEAKAKASEELAGLYPDMGATMMKIRIEANCKKELYALKFAERLDAGCVHQLDALRSQLSYLKTILNEGI